MAGCLLNLLLKHPQGWVDAGEERRHERRWEWFNFFSLFLSAAGKKNVCNLPERTILSEWDQNWLYEAEMKWKMFERRLVKINKEGRKKWWVFWRDSQSIHRVGDIFDINLSSVIIHWTALSHMGCIWEEWDSRNVTPCHTHSPVQWSPAKVEKVRWKRVHLKCWFGISLQISSNYM